MKTIGGFQVILALYTLGAWITNLVQLIGCDFASPYKEEIFHIIGIFVLPVSWVVIWL